MKDTLQTCFFLEMKVCSTLYLLGISKAKYSHVTAILTFSLSLSRYDSATLVNWDPRQNFSKS